MLIDLRDGNALAALDLLGLWNDNRQNTILHAGLDTVLVDSGWEVERPGELSNRAFRDPELLLRLLLTLLRLLIADLHLSLLLLLLLSLVCDTGLAWLMLLALLRNSALLLSLTKKAGWWCALLITPLAASLDAQGLLVGKLNLDILLLDTRQLSMQFISALCLLNIELWIESLCQLAGSTVGGWCDLAVGIKVVEEAEERGEALGGVVGGWVAEVSWEERHVSGCGDGGVVSDSEAASSWVADDCA